MNKEERYKKWCKENPDNKVVKELQRNIEAEELNNYIKEKRKEGMTFNEISVILGMSRQAVYFRDKQTRTKILS